MGTILFIGALFVGALVSVLFINACFAMRKPETRNAKTIVLLIVGILLVACGFYAASRFYTLIVIAYAIGLLFGVMPFVKTQLDLHPETEEDEETEETSVKE